MVTSKAMSPKNFFSIYILVCIFISASISCAMGNGGSLRSNGDGVLDGLTSNAIGQHSLDDIEGESQDIDGVAEDGDDEESQDEGNENVVKEILKKESEEKDEGAGEGGEDADAPNTKKEGNEAQKKENDFYFCHHKAACGTRGLNSGPATADTLHNGYECYCRGPAQLGLKSNCYRGHCYNPNLESEIYRNPTGVDKHGSCIYTISASSSADFSFCGVKPAEEDDPNLKYFTDPPLLVEKENYGQEIAIASRIGSEALS